jgi:deoxyhypusine synthase
MAEAGPSSAQAAVFVRSAPVPASYAQVRGPNFDDEQTLDSLMDAYARVGFQASGVARAIDVVEQMRTWRLSDDAIDDSTPDELLDPAVRAATKATIFLGFTSNLISSGLREVILFLVKHKMVSALVTTAGGVEEDLIKCLGPTYLGAFALDGRELRKKGLNRIGNLLVPNDNYCKFEDWVMPILEKMRAEQGDSVTQVWTPSKVIERLGREIDDERSVLYWAQRVSVGRGASLLGLP